MRPVELGFAAVTDDLGVDDAECAVVVTNQEVVLAAEVERGLDAVDHDRSALEHFACAVDDARRKARPKVVRVTLFVPAFLARRERRDDARKRTLVRDAVSILKPETLSAARPTESQVGRADASLGDLYRHRWLPYMWGLGGGFEFYARLEMNGNCVAPLPYVRFAAPLSMLRDQQRQATRGLVRLSVYMPRYYVYTYSDR